MKARKVKRPRPATVDFETFGIEPRPAYPPRPVGVSIKYPGKKARYYAFGHARCSHCGSPAQNNCTEAEAKRALREAYRWRDGILCQNGKFDVDVAETHWGLRMPRWQDVHDTMFLIFLDDPNQQTFSLKPSAERLLGMAPEERDAVGDWLIEHQPVPNVKISRSKSSEHYFGRYIALAPGGLVGAYANGDVIRTEDVFSLLWPRIVARGMLDAYDRERKLMPILLGMERQGVPVDRRRLARDVLRYRAWLTKVDAWILKTIRAPDGLNLDSGEQLVAAMVKARKADPRRLPLTKTGKRQHNKEALIGAVTDPQLLAMLKYRTQLKTCLQTFMEPWLATADASIAKGLASRAMVKAGLSLIFTTWNQVKGDGRGGSNAGARTGRLSSTPNFQNIPKEFQPIWTHEKKGLARCPLKGLPALPLVRRYVVPFPGEVLIDRDYSQQEPRILAHFDGGAIMKMYVDDPWMDFHDKVREELARAGLHYERRPVKNTGLGLIYGMGVGKLAEKNGLPVEEAKKLKAAILRILVGLKRMYQECKARAKSNEPVRTWGGREYHCEPARIVEGRLREFDYKMVNVLVQGSAADCTKEAIIRFDAARDRRTRLLLNVHDQLTSSTPPRLVDGEMERKRKTMEGVEFDVSMLTEGSTSDRSWAELENYDKRGARV